MPQPSARLQVGDFLLARILSAVAEATLRILPRIGRIAWVLRSRACLAEPPALSPSTMNSSVPSRVVVGAIGELAGQAQLARGGRGLALDLALGAAAQALVHPLDDRAEQRPAAVHIVGEIMVEMVAHGGLDEARRLEAGQAVLGLALEMRIADEDAEHQLDAVEDVVGGDVLGLLVADQLAEGADALGQRGAQARFVRAAVGRRDGVAVIAFAAVGLERPGDRPFGAALARSGKSWRPVKGWLVTVGRSPSCSARWSARPPGNWKTACSGTSATRERRVAAPADLDAGEQIGLGAGELVEALGREGRVRAENLGVGREG